MLNHEGKVIGINVAIAQQAQNVGFAIPVFHLTQVNFFKKKKKSFCIIKKSFMKL